MNTDKVKIGKDIYLYNESCLDVLKRMPDNSVDLIITDPPYEISATNGGGTINKVKKLNKSLSGLVEADITSGYDIEMFGEEFCRVMKDINIYLWCNKAQIPKYFEYYVGKKGCKFDILFWNKTNALPTYSNKYLSDTEYCLYFHKGKGHCFPSSYEDAKTMYQAPINQKDKKAWGHPSIKPLDITEKIIRNSSKEGDLIFDPFVGSGTTCVAAHNMGRRSCGVEINKDFFDIAVKRTGECIV